MAGEIGGIHCHLVFDVPACGVSHHHRAQAADCIRPLRRALPARSRLLETCVRRRICSGYERSGAELTRSIALGDTDTGDGKRREGAWRHNRADRRARPARGTDDGDGGAVRVGGHRVRALLILLALDAGRVVPPARLIERLWPDDRPADAANALQSLVSRLRVALRQAGVDNGVLESSPAGYRLAVPPEAVDAVAFERPARAGGQALAGGDAPAAVRLLREALAAWRGPALADVAGEEFAAAPAARLEELRAAALLDRIEADLALGEASRPDRRAPRADRRRPAGRAPARPPDARPGRRRPPGGGAGRLPADAATCSRTASAWTRPRGLSRPTSRSCGRRSRSSPSAAARPPLPDYPERRGGASPSPRPPRLPGCASARRPASSAGTTTWPAC